MHYQLVHHQFRAVWPIAFRSKRLYHISVLSICFLRHVLKADIHGVQWPHEQNTTRIAKSRALKRGTSRKRHKLGNGRIVVDMLVNISMLSLFLTFFVLSHTISTQHPHFPPSIPLILFKLSTQHQPAITRIENWAILPTQGLQFSYTLIRAFSKISAYTKTVQFYSTKNTSMNKFLAESSSPCLMLGIPPASLSEGWLLRSREKHNIYYNVSSKYFAT